MTEEQVFLAALELSDDAARAAYLDEACGQNAALRRQVEALLASHFKSGEFLDVPAPEQVDMGTDADLPVTIQSDAMPAHTSTDDEDESLSFLSPGTRPDSLGRIGHYEVLQVLGKGGFGIVFRAFDDTLQRVVAIKVMAPQLAVTSPARKRFLREAKNSAQVRHEHVVQVYAVEELPLPYLAMEFIPGETLQQRLDRVGPLDVPETLRIGRQIAEGLAAAHATDLIHRDIKPGNVLLEGGQHKVKITDFGLARAADDASMTQSGMIAGTPMYMAPEQAKGETLDQRADLFSLGSVMYQMVAGRAPFRANTTVAVLKRVAEDTPRNIREVIPETPQWLCDIISKLHAKDPKDRFQSAREVADVLADCEAQLKGHSRLQDFSRIPRAPRQPTSHQKAMLIATAIFAIPLIALAVTEATGWTHLFLGRPAVNQPIQTVPVAANEKRDAEGWVQLFNGTDFTGWKQDGYWTIENGMLVSRIPASPTQQPGFLTTEFSDFRDFHLRVEGKINAPGDSGLFFRFGEQGDASLQAQIVPSPNHAGSLLRHADVVVPATATIKAEKWFTMEVIAQGPLVEVFVDGQKASEWSYPAGAVPSGPIALESGFPKTEFMVRKVEVRPPSASRAPEPGWVQLFNGKDLTGWKVHPVQAADWSAKDGILACRGPMSHLFTERGDYRDFQLRFEWRASRPEADSGVYFRCDYSINRGFPPGYEINLGRGDNGTLMQTPPTKIGGDRLTASARAQLEPNQWRIGEIKVVGQQVTATIDGTVVAQYEKLSPSRPFGHIALEHIPNQDAASFIEFRKIEIKELPPEEPVWVQLFNGKDLTGWKLHPDQPSSWTVQDGAIVGRGDESYLYSERSDYQDFHLRAKVRVGATANSGIHFRSTFSPTIPDGYEAQINIGSDKWLTGTLFKLPLGGSDWLLNHVKKSGVRPDELFTFEIVAQGDHLVTKVDGVVVSDVRNDKYGAGHIALQTGLRSAGEVRFSSIEIKERSASASAAPPHSKTPSAWSSSSSPKASPGSAAARTSRATK